MRRRVWIATLALAAIGLAGWAAVGFGGDTSRKPPAEVQAASSQYGEVLFDGKGFALYLFTRDRRDKSRCYGACAKAWPPFLTKGKPATGTGADPGLLGTTKRRDGSKQVTYKGHPLYYYEHDDDPGEVLCHDVSEFGGRWLVVKPDGHAAD